tara:strand:- start:303 stop:572 length:270 start_codon:yes stop_codon:yes gene_type:complete
MWWAGLAGWPNGASEQAAERCFDRNSMTAPAPVSSGNFGGGIMRKRMLNPPLDELDLPAIENVESGRQKPSGLMIILLIVVAYLIFKKK